MTDMKSTTETEMKESNTMTSIDKANDDFESFKPIYHAIEAAKAANDAALTAKRDAADATYDAVYDAYEAPSYKEVKAAYYKHLNARRDAAKAALAEADAALAEADAAFDAALEDAA